MCPRLPQLWQVAWQNLHSDAQYSSASRAWGPWLEWSTSLQSGALWRGEWRANGRQRGARRMNERWVVTRRCSRCPWTVVDRSAVRYRRLKQSELGSNGVHFCHAGVLQLFDLSVCRLDGLSYFKSLLKCELINHAPVCYQLRPLLTDQFN